jgi:hypothetical protein
MSYLGNKWLLEHFELPNLFLHHTSKLGTRMAQTESADGRITQVYLPSYDPGNQPLDHVQFALRYDGIDLGVLRRVFQRIDAAEVLAFIHRHPAGRFTRLIGFLYELLTGIELDVTCGGNYVRVLDPDEYFVGAGQRYPKWRVLNNLPGPVTFCPLVRKTPTIVAGLQKPWQERVKETLHSVSPEAYKRAIAYLYLKETRSSYAIEHETVSGDRQERFVGILHRAGRENLEQVLSEAELTELQNVIVDPRYAASGFRTDQVYVGERLPNYSERIHYVCPPPQFVSTLMQGLLELSQRTEGLPPIVRAVMTAFGFVFIHPFDDGNGRIHRFLLHDLLARGFIEPGVILPVSASMLAHPEDYDRCLEQFSRQVKTFAHYDMSAMGEMTVRNDEEIEPLYRFPDLTAQVEYFLNVLEDTVSYQLPNELDVLRGFDQARSSIRHIVDLPDRRLDQLLHFLHSNHGRLSKAKRPQFQELNEGEIIAIEQAFGAAFSKNEEK